jgi:hypothetical protein
MRINKQSIQWCKPDGYYSDLDFLVNALVAIDYMRPRQWMAAFGGFGANRQVIPVGNKHLCKEYTELRKEIKSKIPIITPTKE